MEIFVRNKTITSVCFSTTEAAWKIEDSILVLEYLKTKNKVVLGGDILTEKLEYTYDSWYYNIESSQNTQYNVERSAKLAFDYISNYVGLNGNGFYVVFVVAQID